VIESAAVTNCRLGGQGGCIQERVPSADTMMTHGEWSAAIRVLIPGSTH
jgi:hypothetical protein